MAEYIEREAVKRLINNNFSGLLAAIDLIPVVDVVPVTEKIPPDQEDVLVLTRSKNGVRNVDKGYWAIDHFIHRGRAVVTHWMPLPGWPEVENG